MKNAKRFSVFLLVTVLVLQCFLNAGAVGSPNINEPIPTDNVKICVKSSEGIILKNVSVKYHGNFPWTNFGKVDNSGVVTGNVKPGKYEFVINYSQMSIKETLNVSADNIYELTYSTILTQVEFYDTNGNPVKGVGIGYHGDGPWNNIGKTDASGKVQKELLPGQYQFTCTYKNVVYNKTQDIGINPVVVLGGKPSVVTPTITPTNTPCTSTPTTIPSQKTIIVSNLSELMATEDSTKTGNVTVLIKDGVYEMTKGLWLTGTNITYKSYSGNRDAVILKGNFKSTHIFWVTSDNVTIEDLTLGEVKNHAIQVHGEMDADKTLIRNVRFFNIREQFIKGSFSNSSQNYSDDCIVENCLFEFTGPGAYQYYTGGIDVHKGKNWIVRYNTFKNIQYSSYITEGAIHFWNSSENTLIEGNKIINCDRGILLGLDNNPHYGGIVRNNFVQTSKDVGIYLCNAQNVKVYNNTVFSAPNYKNSIEYRFTTTGSEIMNNLTNKAIASRNNGTANVENNVTNAIESWFNDVKNGDFHLVLYINSVVNKGKDLNEVLFDFDGDARQKGESEIGADELNK